MSSNTSTNYKLRTYDVYWGGVFLGRTAPGTVNIPINGQYVDIESDQVEGIADVIPKGVITGPIEMELQNADLNFVNGTLFDGQVETVTSGDLISAGLGFKTRDSNDIVKRLLLHPTGVERADDTNDIVLFRTFPRIAATLTGQRDQEQRIAISMAALPDENEAIGFQYGRLGSPSLVQATPEFVMIGMDDCFRAPYMTMTALGLITGQKDRLEAGAFFGTASGVTMDVNGAQTDTDTDIEFDGLSSARAVVAGDWIKNQTTGELMYVDSVAYTDDFSGTLTVVRGVPNATGSAMADNEVLEIQSSTYIRRVRDSATWASSNTAAAVVGNIFAAGDDTAKGVIKSGTTPGASNVTATVNAVASDNLVATLT